MNIMQLTENTRINRLIQRIHGALDAALLKPRYRQEVEADPDLHCTHGHCYAASEALWHALGGMDSPWRPVVAKDEDGTHWWLTNLETGEVADPTSDQYTSRGKEPPYHAGRRVGFLTKEPSKRAAQIIRRAGLSAPVPNSNAPTSRT